MAEETQWQRDAYSFANDLFFFLFKKLRMTSYLPPSIKGYFEKSFYTDAIGKAILYLWHSFREEHRLLLMSSRLETAQNAREFFQYLEASTCCQHEREDENTFMIVADMSVQLLETCVYLLEKEHISFFPLIVTGWTHLFGLYYKNRFFARGGWNGLGLECVNCAVQYDMMTRLMPPGYLFTKADIEILFNMKLPDTTSEIYEYMSEMDLLPDINSPNTEGIPRQQGVKTSFVSSNECECISEVPKANERFDCLHTSIDELAHHCQTNIASTSSGNITSPKIGYLPEKSVKTKDSGVAKSEILDIANPQVSVYNMKDSQILTLLEPVQLTDEEVGLLVNVEVVPGQKSKKSKKKKKSRR